MASFALWGTTESATAAALAPYDAQTRIVTTRGLPPSLASSGEEDPTTMTSLTPHRTFQLRAPCRHWSVDGKSIAVGSLPNHRVISPILGHLAVIGESATGKGSVKR